MVGQATLCCQPVCNCKDQKRNATACKVTLRADLKLPTQMKRKTDARAKLYAHLPLPSPHLPKTCQAHHCTPNPNSIIPAPHTQKTPAECISGHQKQCKRSPPLASKLNGKPHRPQPSHSTKAVEQAAAAPLNRLCCCLHHHCCC